MAVIPTDGPPKQCFSVDVFSFFSIYKNKKLPDYQFQILLWQKICGEETHQSRSAQRSPWHYKLQIAASPPITERLRTDCTPKFVGISASLLSNYQKQYLNNQKHTHQSPQLKPFNPIWQIIPIFPSFKPYTTRHIHFYPDAKPNFLQIEYIHRT